MKRLLVLGFLAALAPSLWSGDQDYYLSVALKDAIHRVDATTGQVSVFASGLLTPFYGYFGTDGLLYMPDSELGAVLTIDAQGGISVLTAGGLLKSPVTAIPDPNGGLVVSDLLAHRIVHVASDGKQTLIHDQASSGGLIYGPGGMAYAPDGSLYVAGNWGDTIVRIDPSNKATLFSSSSLISSPGGVAIDNAGNMFVAQYSGNRILRFRLDSGEVEVFAEDLQYMLRPNDVKLSRSGGLLTTTKLSNLLRIDALGQITQLFQDLTYGDIVGVAVPEDATPCSGSFVKYGHGTAGGGGHVPELRAIFSPCPGAHIALEFRDFLGGTSGALFVGLKADAVPMEGGTLLIDPAQPFFMIPFGFPGAGAGGGDFTLPFTMNNNPSTIGLKLYLQAAAADPGAPFGVSFSNGLEETIGS